MTMTQQPAKKEAMSKAKVSGVKKIEEKKPAAEKKAAAPKKESAHGKVKVTQMVGCIARRRDQEATLIGLGLNKRHRSRVLEDTPCVRGMIYKVRHLVKAETV